MNKRGSIPLFVAATLPIALVGGVFAVDAARVWLAQARLQTALDAAALTAARDIDSPNRDANARAVLAANFNGGAPGRADSAWDSVSVVPSSDGNSVEVKASVKVEPLLNRLANIGHVLDALDQSSDRSGAPSTLKGGPILPRVISRSASAIRSSTGIELALVFDTTLSMAQRSSATNLMHIESARDAALEMLKVMYGDAPNTTRREWLQGLYVSIVPFNIAVNIGTANAHLLDGSVAAPNYRDNTNNRTLSWSGCIEARQGNYHLTDDGPMVSGAGFRRYYWPSSYDTRNLVGSGKGSNNGEGSGNGQCTSYQAYKNSNTVDVGSANGVCMAHNDWTAPLNAQAQNNFIVDANKYVQNQLEVDKSLSFGPNTMCPTTPILPLTMDRKTIEGRLALLPDLPFAFGTMLAPGLQGAWYTLSPQWRRGTTAGGNGWTRVEPVATDGRPEVPALPLDYDTEHTRKVVVILSDGDNNWPNARNITSAVKGKTSGNESRVVMPESDRTELFYTAYGFLSTETRLGINVPHNGQMRPHNASQLNTDYANVRNNPDGADARLDVATRQLCTNMKADNRITIYAIGFGIAEEAHRQLLKDCATSTGHFFEAPTPEKLKEVFSAIARELASLRLSQ